MPGGAVLPRARRLRPRRGPPAEPRPRPLPRSARSSPAPAARGWAASARPRPGPRCPACRCRHRRRRGVRRRPDPRPSSTMSAARRELTCAAPLDTKRNRSAGERLGQQLLLVRVETDRAVFSSSIPRVSIRVRATSRGVRCARRCPAGSLPLSACSAWCASPTTREAKCGFITPSGSAGARGSPARSAARRRWCRRSCACSSSETSPPNTVATSPRATGPPTRDHREVHRDPPDDRAHGARPARPRPRLLRDRGTPSAYPMPSVATWVSHRRRVQVAP